MPKLVRTTPGWNDTLVMSGQRRAAAAAQRMLADFAAPYAVHALYFASAPAKRSGAGAPCPCARDAVVTTRPPAD